VVFKSRIFSGFKNEEEMDMKRTRYSEPQILLILKQASSGVGVPQQSLRAWDELSRFLQMAG
jgi:hypothetical protein